MTARYYMCPMETATLTGAETYQRPRAARYAAAWAMTSKAGASWALAYIDLLDWTAIDADAQCADVLQKFTDAAAANSPSQLRAWLASHTVGEIPAAKRTSIQTKLAAQGVDLTGIGLASTLEDLMLRVLQFHVPNAALQNLGVNLQ